MGHEQIEQDNNAKSGVASNAMWKLFERFGAQFVSLLVSIILARILDPENYGVIAIITVFISIFDIFITNGLPAAYIQKKDADDKDLSSIFIFNVFLSIALYVVLFFIARPVGSFYENEGLVWPLRILSISIVIGSFNSVFQAQISKNMKFKKFFFATLIGTILSAVAGIVAALKGLGVWALVIQQLTNRFIDTVILAFVVKWPKKIHFSIRRVWTMFSFGWKLLLASLIDALYLDACSLIIGKRYSTNELAFYNKGEQFPKLMIINISVSIQSVLFAAMSRFQENKEKIRSLLTKSISVSTYVVLPVLFGMAACADEFIYVILTEKWMEAVPYLQIFCANYVFNVIQSANLQPIKSIGKSNVFLILEIIQKVICAILLILFFKMGSLYIALSILISNAINTIILMIPNKIYFNYTFKHQFSALAKPFICAIIMFACVWPIRFLPISIYLIFAIKLFVGVVVYMLLSIVIKPYGYKYAKEKASAFLLRTSKKGV